MPPAASLSAPLAAAPGLALDRRTLLALAAVYVLWGSTYYAISVAVAGGLPPLAMRHSVSTSVASCGLLFVHETDGELPGSSVLGGVVGDVVLPAVPDDAAPSAAQNAESVGGPAAAVSGAL